MKNVIIFGAVSVMVVGLVLLGFFVFTKPKQSDIDNSWKGKELAKEGEFILYGLYNDDKWEYKLEGFLPSHCHTGILNIAISTSLQDQVIMKIDIKKPEKDVMCAQSLLPFNREGTLEASRDAEFDIVIKNE